MNPGFIACLGQAIAHFKLHLIRLASASQLQRLIFAGRVYEKRICGVILAELVGELAKAGCPLRSVVLIKQVFVEGCRHKALLMAECCRYDSLGTLFKEAEFRSLLEVFVRRLIESFNRRLTGDLTSGCCFCLDFEFDRINHS